jgi:plasmid stabilization system protein ParE
MNVRLLAPAQSELDEAMCWYAAQAPGIYTVEAGEILILAVAHQHRRPSYWQDRNG